MQSSSRRDAGIPLSDEGEYASRLRSAIDLANLPALLCVLAQLTGDMSWLRPPYAPTYPSGISDNDTGGFSAAVQATVRAAALDAILAWRAGQPVEIWEPSGDLLVEMLRVSMGEREIPGEYGPLLESEYRAAGVNGRHGDAHLPGWSVTGVRIPPDLPVPEGFSALIIGAGISGLTAAIAFAEAGIPYRILEKHGEVGGTWLENDYPGAGVDTPNHLYSWPGIPADWEHYFSLQPELHAYIRRVASEYGVRPNIQFDTAVARARYVRQEQRWVVQAEGPEGPRTYSANILVSAVGLFNAPKLPDIHGMEQFGGHAFHSANWPAGTDLRGKRVAVIGNGASAMQIVPAIEGKVRSLTLFQRSPHWVAPFEKWHAEVPEPVRFLLTEVPLYQWWYRERLTWMFNDKFFPVMRKDPQWPHPERSVSALNDRYREAFTRYIHEQLHGRDDLIAKVLPAYPPYGKRILLDNGWYRTLLKDHVALVDVPVQEITADSVVTADGENYLADVIIYATGFHAARFLSTYEVIGRDGQSLRDAWDDDDCRAYLGSVVPGFPNLFIVFGPNVLSGHGGSFMSIVGSQVQYLLGVVEKMLKGGIGAVDCRPEVCERYNEQIDAAHETLIWTHPGMSTYYRNSRGRLTVNIPYRTIDYWHWVQHPDLCDFVTEPSAAARPASVETAGARPGQP